jgi:serine phosphatase RsbU (regulator of sigma subunit)
MIGLLGEPFVTAPAPTDTGTDATIPASRVDNGSRAARVDNADTIAVLSRVGNMSVAARCVPSGPRGEPVAGDFFDVFPLDHTHLLIAVGDIAGHGCSATSRMIELRAQTRAIALSGWQPAEVLRQLDLIEAPRDTDTIATLWLGIYHAPSGLLKYSSAGHPPPVFAGILGPPRLLTEASAPPLGTGVVGWHAVNDEIEWPVGAVLIAYSDGLVERPECDLEEQIERLRALVERDYQPSTGLTLDDLAAKILAELVPDATSARDDICILLLRRDEIDQGTAGTDRQGQVA